MMLHLFTAYFTLAIIAACVVVVDAWKYKTHFSAVMGNLGDVLWHISRVFFLLYIAFGLFWIYVKYAA